ncbi:MAG: Gfo/Idh/MocA family oxidoreductase [Bryobacteraceae bacterium]
MPTTERRQFLLGSAAALVSSSALAAPDREVRTAMVGVGNRGTNLLSQVLQQPGVKITAICDTDAKARDAAQGAARRDNPKSYSDYRQALQLDNVDAVVIATPCYLHAEMAAACLEAGKYVYCEKPLGITPEQVDLVLKASARSKTFLQIGQQLRYVPSLRRSSEKSKRIRSSGTSLSLKRSATAPRYLPWLSRLARNGTRT